MKEQHQIRMAAQMVGPTRTEKLMGKDYLVVSSTLVKSQVLNNNLGACFLPPEEFTDDWAASANGHPVVVGEHPTIRGRSVSARSPDILNSRGAGQLYNVTNEPGKMRADVYLDPDRAAEVDGLQEIFNSLEAGETVELSTGFPVFIEKRNGVENGKAYNLVIHPAGFDHLAVFAGGELIGACSVADGCGLGANAAAAEEEGADMEQKDGRGRFRRAFDALLRSITPDSGILDGLVENESDEDRRRALNAALREKFGGLNREVYVEAVFSEENLVVFEVWENDSLSLHRSPYEMDEGGVITLGDPVEVRRVTSYEPVTAPAMLSETGTNQQEEGEEMKREELILQLSKGCPTAKAALEKLDEKDLLAIQGLSEEQSGEEVEVPAAEPAEGAQGGQEEPSSAMQALVETVESLKAELATMKETTAPAVAEQERVRAELVATLAANEKVPFTKEELDPKPMVELEKIHAMSRGASYAGRGVQNAGAEPQEALQFMPHTPYWQKPVEAGKGD